MVDNIALPSDATSSNISELTEVNVSMRIREFYFSHVLQYKPYKFILLEALSATGLRSIRYAKEIPLVR